MDNIRKTIEILFKRQNPENIINNFYYKNGKALLPPEFFSMYYINDFKRRYTKNEIENIYDILKNNWCKVENVKNKTVFNLLVNLTKEILIEIDETPVCKYENLLKWREISFQVGEDLLTTSFLAYKDFLLNKKRNFFTWNIIISNNNAKIKSILKEGCAENHFHLKGSAPHFQITWINLMNFIIKRNKEFKKLYKEVKLSPEIQGEFIKNFDSDLYDLVKKAALIRVYLFYKYIIKTKEIKIDIKKILVSKNPLEMELKTQEIQMHINNARYFYGKRIKNNILDYTIPKNILGIDFDKKIKNEKIILYGERYFLYSIFKNIFQENSDLLYEQEIFYTYLIIKEKFRDEIIQTNRCIGFKNFENYQNRKMYFIPKNSIYEKFIINLAVNSSIKDQKIDLLEIRIAPKDIKKDIHNDILNYDKIIQKNLLNQYNLSSFLSKEKNYEEKFFYTLHFIKTPDTPISEQKMLLKSLYPRNYKTRKYIKKQALELNKLRESSLKSAKRILGIDAANTEIGCRPEVFGQVFRYIKYYNSITDLKSLQINNFKQLGVTFHVGEDFFDIMDGLRAIDEATRFLNLSYGDRLGHALALGINSDEFYKSKENLIILSKQELLDNVVWSLIKIRDFDLDISLNYISELKNLYKQLFLDIFCKVEISFEYYYESWKLRGDNPEIYKDEIYKDEIYEKKMPDSIFEYKKHYFSFFQKCGFNNILDTDIARMNPTARNLFAKFHYDYKIKKNGDTKIEFKVTTEHIRVIKLLQKSLQNDLAKKGIYIETNPSSNYLIGPIIKYSQHPIVRFHNLNSDNEENLLSVSINTDDQGVFATSLENEYALIAIALEKEKNEFGNYIYKQHYIYEWLNKIRQMGIEQSFKNK